MTVPPRRAYGLSEFAAMAGLSPSTVQQRMDDGEIPELERIGHRRFIPAVWVERWASKVVNQPAASAAPALAALTTGATR